MKKLLNLLLVLILSASLYAQNDSLGPVHKASFELGKGLSFLLNNGDYTFSLGGMIQPYIALDKTEDNDADYFFNAKRTYFNISGRAIKEKVGFFIQTDFSLGQPLLDAYITYYPKENIEISFGQRQNIANNREMLLMEDHLQFADRSLLSSAFSQSGREFGFFIIPKLSLGHFSFVPQISITSGDGRNSFGENSRDLDLGGFKYSARLDLLPFGFFTKDNDKQLADLAHESKPKIVLGIAASYNDGASNKTGEGHGDFFLFNREFEDQLPDYRQLFGDILFKYKGFHFLGEYGISSATNLEGAFTDVIAQNSLVPTQISEFLALGSAFNSQIGYVSKKGLGVDLRYSRTEAEFKDNVSSIIKDNSAISLGLSKYVKQNSLKYTFAITQLETENVDSNLLKAEFMVQIIF